MLCLLNLILSSFLPTFILIFMIKLNYREIETLAQEYKANKQKSSDSNLIMAIHKAFFKP